MKLSRLYTSLLMTLCLYISNAQGSPEPLRSTVQSQIEGKSLISALDSILSDNSGESLVTLEKVRLFYSTNSSEINKLSSCEREVMNIKVEKRILEDLLANKNTLSAKIERYQSM